MCQNQHAEIRIHKVQVVFSTGVAEILYLNGWILYRRKRAIIHSSFPTTTTTYWACLFPSLHTKLLPAHLSTGKKTLGSLEARWRPGSHVRRTGSFQKPLKLSSCSSSCSALFLGQQKRLWVFLKFIYRHNVFHPTTCKLLNISME